MQTGDVALHSDRCVGCILSVFIGDALGAAVEGWGRTRIRTNHGRLRDFVPSRHMGVEHLPLRCGVYTDDTNSTLALADSLVACQGLDAQHAATNYALFFREAVPQRGYPHTAQLAMEAVLAGEDIRLTGRKAFADGSYANGGAMRISPLGLCFRNASAARLRQAVCQAIVSSHVHPQGVDGAVVQATAVAFLAKSSAASFEPRVFLAAVHRAAETPEMRRRIGDLQEHLGQPSWPSAFFRMGGRWDVRLAEEAERTPTGGSGDVEGDMRFQIEAVSAVGVALWAFLTHWDAPEEAIVEAVAVGGDTDTIASMTGAMAGALHGSGWIPQRWIDGMDNGTPRSRDFAIQTARALAKLDLRSVMVPVDLS